MRAIYLALTLGVSLRTFASVGVCRLYGDAYRSEIRPKIQAGIPFELMSILVDDGEIVSKKPLRVSYNLWDEMVSVQSGEKTLSRTSLSGFENELCKHLEISDELKKDHKYVFRILLNPMWAERMTRLQVVSDQGGKPSKLVDVNWRKIASEMPSEKVLLEKEMKP